MFICLYFSISLQIFLVTGGRYSPTSEILVDSKNQWKILEHAALQLFSLRLATINNEVFCFGK